MVYRGARALDKGRAFVWLSLVLSTLEQIVAKSNPEGRRHTAKVHKYEVAIIVRPEIEEEGQQAIVERLSQILTSDGGEVTQVDNWGRRRLAYPINKVTDGYYYFIQGQFSSSVLPELDRTARMSEDIVRHMVVRMDQ
jgi:small subunit ribosomal protein S6